MRAVQGELQSLTRLDVSSARQIQRRHGLEFRPLITTPEAEIEDFRKRAMQRSHVHQPDMKRILALNLPAHDRAP